MTVKVCRAAVLGPKKGSHTSLRVTRSCLQVVRTLVLPQPAHWAKGKAGDPDPPRDYLGSRYVLAGKMGRNLQPQC